jgi:hypothetical protein
MIGFDVKQTGQFEQQFFVCSTLTKCKVPIFETYHSRFQKISKILGNFDEYFAKQTEIYNFEIENFG